MRLMLQNSHASASSYVAGGWSSASCPHGRTERTHRAGASGTSPAPHGGGLAAAEGAGGAAGRRHRYTGTHLEPYPHQRGPLDVRRRQQLPIVRQRLVCIQCAQQAVSHALHPADALGAETTIDDEGGLQSGSGRDDLAMAPWARLAPLSVLRPALPEPDRLPAALAGSAAKRVDDQPRISAACSRNQA